MRYVPFMMFWILSSCTLGPNYKKPDNNITNTWTSMEDKPVADVLSAEPANDWWNVFNDNLLTKYIHRASQYNNDILTASSNILQARALRQIAASSFFPQLNSLVNATKIYYSKNGPAFTFDQGDNTPGLPFGLQVPQIQNLYNILFDASWEIDIFGKTRRTVEAAEAHIGEVIEQRNDVLVTVIAEIARNYMELRSLQEKTELIQENISFLERKQLLIEQQFHFGYVSRLDYENIQATLSAEKAKLPPLEAKIYQNIYAISVLTGSAPQALLEELLPFQALPKLPKTIAIGLKSDLLRRRPDIRKAERHLAMATAGVGVAITQFFPTFTLSADAGLQSLALKNLFSLGSKTWDYGGGFSLPIFQGGKLKGNLEAKKADMIAAGYQYQQTVLKALEEAESALASYTHSLKTLEETINKTIHYEKMVDLSQERNLAGLINMIDLLDQKIRLNESAQSLLEQDFLSIIDLISLYKVLGGGWQNEEDS